jgi:hypothetical protein
MRPLALLIVALALPAMAESRRSALRPPPRRTPTVVVLRRPGLATYEAVAEEFRERVRAAVRVLAVRTERHGHTLGRWLMEHPPTLVFAIGQSAYDAARAAKVRGPLLHALVYHRRDPADLRIDARVPAQAVLHAFHTARPEIGEIALLHGAETASMLDEARVSARPLGLSVIGLAAENPADAIVRLRHLPRGIEGLWLTADLSVLSPQVVQYAIGLQLRRRIPLMGVTQRHARQGALFAIDFAPAMIGRHAAALANLMANRRELFAATEHLPARITVNLSTARRIGIAPAPLRRLASELVR